MQAGIRKALKITGYTLGTLAGITGAYLGAAFVLGRVPVPARQLPGPDEIELYLLSNGVHMDIVVPIKTSQIDWSQQLLFSHTTAADSRMRYVAFGWGDKGFYLDTPTWAELKVSTALIAGFHLGSSAMHTTFYQEMHPGQTCIKLALSQEEYARLIAYIQQSFRYDAAGQVQHISGHSYGKHDAFYKAHRVYSLLYTCNTWTNNALKACGQPACVWTPFDSGIFYQYRHEIPSATTKNPHSLHLQ